MIVADSDVLSDALRGRKRARARIELELETGRLATTTVTVFELLAGARTDRERAKVELLLAALQPLSVDDAAARRAAEVDRLLSAQGERLAPADTLVAGICLARSAILLTKNRRHFERVPGLHLGSLDPDEP
jgi:tRNA(fMet)-specific endonuclease VapC